MSVDFSNETVVFLGRLALAALLAVPLDPEKDAPILAQMAMCGRRSSSTISRILRSGPARVKVARALIIEFERKPGYETSATLKVLDSRAAYPLIMSMKGASRKSGLFRSLNGLGPGQQPAIGSQVKLVVD